MGNGLFSLFPGDTKAGVFWDMIIWRNHGIRLTYYPLDNTWERIWNHDPEGLEHQTKSPRLLPSSH